MLLAGNRYFQTAYLPAGVDPDILELYRAAFSDLAADENFKKDLKAAVITLTFAGGAEVDAFRQQLIDTDPALWQKAYELIAPPK
jgi:tripartite-type tricarboxylate transporter receptor subunit TctC